MKMESSAIIAAVGATMIGNVTTGTIAARVRVPPVMRSIIAVIAVHVMTITNCAMIAGIVWKTIANVTRNAEDVMKRAVMSAPNVMKNVPSVPNGFVTIAENVQIAQAMKHTVPSAIFVSIVPKRFVIAARDVRDARNFVENVMKNVPTARKKNCVPSAVHVIPASAEKEIIAKTVRFARIA